MKEITDALDLAEGSDIPAIVEAINKLKEPLPRAGETPSAKLEKRIRAKMRESNGALNYEQAKLAVEGQDTADAARKSGSATGKEKKNK